MQPKRCLLSNALIRGTCLIQDGPVAVVHLLVILGEDAPDLEVALLAIQGVGSEAHVATDRNDELRKGNIVQGDPSCCSIGVVGMKTKLAF